MLTFQHFGNVIGGGVSRLVCRAPVIANQVSSALSMSLPVRAADIVMGSTGFFQCITLNSRDMEREYARYPAPYRAADEARPARLRRQVAQPAKQTLRGSSSSCRRIAPCSAARRGCTRTSGSTRAIRLLAADPSWHLALAGQGADEERLRALANELECRGPAPFHRRDSADVRWPISSACLDVVRFPHAGRNLRPRRGRSRKRRYSLRRQ